MAFKPDENIAKALKQSHPNNNSTNNQNEQNTQNYSDLLNLVSKKNVEKESISITIDSDVKSEIEKLAKKNGYKHLSTFINDYFKKLISLTQNN
ncbi:hypothetical protein CBF53_00950 [Lactobacillus taiwanensis]|uniref:Antitoxin n=1 Tax=Lactobacillus taiwanensis TaxID=508451 RepID=A0ABX4ET30_9LACO|nr:hypothetical protein [Lactobacillus taiwanensis]OYR88911.1 hypothetical protein CBF53_00950 [Lactobacillus taiwanensis]